MDEYWKLEPDADDWVSHSIEHCPDVSLIGLSLAQSAQPEFLSTKLGFDGEPGPEIDYGFVRWMLQMHRQSISKIDLKRWDYLLDVRAVFLKRSQQHLELTNLLTDAEIHAVYLKAVEGQLQIQDHPTPCDRQNRLDENNGACLRNAADILRFQRRLGRIKNDLSECSMVLLRMKFALMHGDFVGLLRMTKVRLENEGKDRGNANTSLLF